MGGESQNFVLFPSSSVDIMREMTGIQNPLTNDTSSKIAEDVTYRIRETLQLAMKYMRHAKRKCLTVEDISKAMKCNDIETIHGHGGIDPIVFKTVTLKDTSVSYIEEKDINLREIAFDSSVPVEKADCYVTGQWLTLEGYPYQDGKINKSTMHIESVKEIVLAYLKCVTNAIKMKNRSMLKAVLADLQTNALLQSVLPYLISYFIDKVIPLHDPDPSQIQLCNAVVLVIRCLSINKSLFLQPYLTQITKLLLHILLLVKLPASEWHIKLSSSYLLGDICRKHAMTCSHLGHKALAECQDVVFNCNDKGMSAVYGALHSILAIESEIFRASCYQLWIPICHALDSWHASPTHSASLEFITLKGAILECVVEILKDRNQSRAFRHLSDSKLNLAEVLSSLGEVTHSRILTSVWRKADSKHVRPRPPHNIKPQDGASSTISPDKNVEQGGIIPDKAIDRSTDCKDDAQEIETSTGTVTLRFVRKRKYEVRQDIEHDIETLVKKTKIHKLSPKRTTLTLPSDIRKLSKQKHIFKKQSGSNLLSLSRILSDLEWII